RARPLWGIHLVYGLEGKRTAMICRTHHCMADGISGVDLLKLVLDMSPRPAARPDVEPLQTPPTPDPLRRSFDSVLGGMQEGMNRLMELQAGLLSLARSLTSDQARAIVPGLSQLVPSLVAPVSLLPFNRACSGERRFVWSTFSFAEARAIRAALKGTVNDVVLTVLSEAVARYAQLHGQPIAGRNLRLMVPVNLRRKEQRGTLGNLISLVPLE